MIFEVSASTLRAWAFVALGAEAVYGDLKVDDRAEDATFQAAFRQLGEEEPHSGEQGTQYRLELDGEVIAAVESSPLPTCAA